MLLCFWMLSASPAAARDLSIEVQPRATSGCRVTLRFALGAQGLVAARRPEIIEAATLTLLDEETDLMARWDGLWLSVAGEGRCRTIIAKTVALWRKAADLVAPARVVSPALSPPHTETLRREGALHRALAAVLGGTETAVPDQTLLELTIDALADAPAILSIEGTIDASDRALLPKSVAMKRPVAVLEARPRLFPPGIDGTTRFWVAWQLAIDAPGPTLAALLGHPGHRLYERLVTDMGLIHTLEAHWLEGPSILAVAGTLPGSGHGAAIERLFVELGALATTITSAEETQAVVGAQILAAAHGGDARAIGDALAGLTRETAAIVIEPARDDIESQVTLIDTKLIALWTAATLDLRCPAPDERRDRNHLLQEVHGLDARRYLAISRALGRDAERMRQLDRELVDRCAEDKKLRALLPSPKLVALHRELLCGRASGGHLDEPAELTRARTIFARYRIDSSVHRPLIAMAKRSPDLKKAIVAIEDRCPGVP